MDSLIKQLAGSTVGMWFSEYLYEGGISFGEMDAIFIRRVPCNISRIIGAVSTLGFFVNALPNNDAGNGIKFGLIGGAIIQASYFRLLPNLEHDNVRKAIAGTVSGVCVALPAAVLINPLVAAVAGMSISYLNSYVT